MTFLRLLKWEMIKLVRRKVSYVGFACSLLFVSLFVWGFQLGSFKGLEFMVARNNLGTALIEMKRYREAIIHLPKWPEPYDKLAKSLSKQGAYQEAVDACDLFVATNPDHKRVPHFEKLARKLKDELRKKTG